jgi:hypothetical protein
MAGYLMRAELRSLPMLCHPCDKNSMASGRQNVVRLNRTWWLLVVAVLALLLVYVAGKLAY